MSPRRPSATPPDGRDGLGRPSPLALTEAGAVVLAVIAFAGGLSGCRQTSSMTNPSVLSADARSQPTASRPRVEPFNQVVKPEVVPTPAADAPAGFIPPAPHLPLAPRPLAGPPTGPFRLPNVNAGKPVYHAVAGPPPVKPARKWRGFLPAHDTDEDRPGWWSPDYRGSTD
jgi:hypothetical protein